MLGKLARVTSNVLTALSLVLFATATVLWVRGRGAADSVSFTTPAGNLWAVRAMDGRLAIFRYAGWPTHEALAWHTVRPPNHADAARQYGYRAVLQSDHPSAVRWRRLGVTFVRAGASIMLG